MLVIPPRKKSEPLGVAGFMASWARSKIRVKLSPPFVDS